MNQIKSAKKWLFQAVTMFITFCLVFSGILYTKGSANGDVRLPIDSSAGNWYGLTYWGHDEYGKYQYSAIDLNLSGGADTGLNVYAVQDGTVSSNTTGCLIIKHTTPLVLRNGYTYSTWYSLYGHMKNSTLTAGTTVTKGAVLGQISNVGLPSSYDPHLHFVLYSYYSTTDVNASISPYWLPGDYYQYSLYADDPYGTREPAGLYEALIFRDMPAASTTSNPANSATTAPTVQASVSGNNVTLSWSGATGTFDHYWLLITNKAGTEVVSKDMGLTTSYTGTFTDNTYHVSVTPINVYTSGKTGSTDFTVSSSAIAPTVQASVSGNNVTLSWSGATGTFDHYWLLITNKAGTEVVSKDMGLTTSYTGTFTDNTYHVSVTPINVYTSGKTGSTDFTVSSSAIAPTVQASVSGNNVTLSWSGATGTFDHYWLLITNKAGTEVVSKDMGLTTSYTGTFTDNTYHVSVTPINVYTSGKTGSTDFTVSSVATAPTVQASVSGNNVTLFWSGTTGTLTHYWLIITNSAGTKVVSKNMGLATSFTGTFADDTYRIYVTPFNGDTQGKTGTAYVTVTNSYTVTFDANGGSVSPSGMSVVNGSTYRTLPTPIRSGYAFDGWYTAPSGGAMISTSSTVALTANQTLYAHWTKSPGGLDNFGQVNTYREGQFSDVPTGSWYSNNAAAAYQYGLMVGSSATMFNVLGNVTVAEAITMASRLNSIYYTGSADFTQDGGAWYSVYVTYAANNGITSKTYDSYTRPATRAEFAEIFAHAVPAEALAAINSVANGAIPDVLLSASYAPSVYLLYRAGIITGSDSAGTFNPSSHISRAEAAAIVTRMVDLSLRQRVTF